MQLWLRNYGVEYYERYQVMKVREQARNLDITHLLEIHSGKGKKGKGKTVHHWRLKNLEGCSAEAEIKLTLYKLF